MLDLCYSPEYVFDRYLRFKGISDYDLTTHLVSGVVYKSYEVHFKSSEDIITFLTSASFYQLEGFDELNVVLSRLTVYVHFFVL